MRLALLAALVCTTLASAQGEPPSRAAQVPPWVALPLPSLCSPAPEALACGPLRDASHVRGPAFEALAPAALEPLPVPLVVALLEEDARAAGLELELARGGPPVLARGSAEALAFARERLAELEADAQALTIELEARLAPGAGASAAERDATAAAAGERWSARALSGQTLAFGLRTRTSFVWDWSVEVAADSAVATPRTGQAWTGNTLHLTAWRVEGGARVLVEGLLDLAELVELTRFDPRTSDLGELEQPHVRAAQLAFSGVLAPDGTLRVELEGLPLAQPAWTLSVRARSTPDPRRDGAPGHALLDVGCVASSPLLLLPPDPGPGLDARAGVDPLGELLEPLSPASLAALAGARRERGRDEDGRAFAPPSWVGSLLLVPRADRATLAEARALVAAAEAARTPTRELELRRGALRARFPLARGRQARLVVGDERPRLIGWAPEIAPESWMAAPEVGVVFDGLVIELAASGESLDARARWSASEEPALLERTSGGVGRTELVRRRAAAAATRVRGESALLLAVEGEPPLELARLP